MKILAQRTQIAFKYYAMAKMQQRNVIMTQLHVSRELRRQIVSQKSTFAFK